MKFRYSSVYQSRPEAVIVAKTQGHVNAISLVGINREPGSRLSDWLSKGCSFNGIKVGLLQRLLQLFFLWFGTGMLDPYINRSSYSLCDPATCLLTQYQQSQQAPGCL